jgi:SRSO17 transposase
MDWETSFDEYLEHLCDTIGHSDRRAGLVGYCQGLMLPIARKSVEPLAAHLEPHRVSARHQSLHHFVSKSEWSDAALIEQVRRWVLPHMNPSNGLYWVIDDTGFPKKGKHSVGVARQYCGQLGKQDNCQVAVSLSVATTEASLPVAYQLYLPQEWADDPERRQLAGVPEEIGFATKPQIAIAQLREARQSKAVPRTELCWLMRVMETTRRFVTALVNSDFNTRWASSRVPAYGHRALSHCLPKHQQARLAGHEACSAGYRDTIPSQPKTLR